MTARILSFSTRKPIAFDSRICVAVAADSPEQLLERAKEVLAGERLVELRLDSLPRPELFLPLLPSLVAEFPDARLVATCRRRVAGGGFGGGIEAELALLEQAAKAGCAVVDLALETAEAMRLDQHQALRTALGASGTVLLISFHDFEGTRDLLPTMNRVLRHRPQIVKIVSMARSLGDNLAVFDLLGREHGCPVVAIAMGEAGLPSRVLGPRAGGLFTFASASDHAPTAPGQLTATALRELYRIDQLSPATRIFGVAGMPIRKSLSPLMQNAAFASEDIDAVLLPLVTDDAAELLHLVRELPLRGASVTMPLKQSVLPHLDSLDSLAARVGACNTIVRHDDGSLHGHNTDVAGVVVPLEERLALQGARVLVRGAGGAARAAVFGLCDKGAEVWIANRTVGAAGRLADEAGAHVFDGATQPRFDVLISAVPAGMSGVAADPFPLGQLEVGLVFDMVYNPLETPLIREARAQGVPVITGLEMFVQQGAGQFALWTGRAAPRDRMAEVVRNALEAREQDATAASASQ